MSNFCEQCGSSLRTGVRFCEECGHPVAKFQEQQGDIVSPRSCPAGPKSPNVVLTKNILLGGGIAIVTIMVVLVGFKFWRGQAMLPESQEKKPLKDKPKIESREQKVVKNKDNFKFNVKIAPKDTQAKMIKTAYGTLSVYHHGKPYGVPGGDQLRLDGKIIYTDKDNMHIYLQNKVFHLIDAEIVPLYEDTGGNIGCSFKLVQINSDGTFLLSKPSLYFRNDTVIEQLSNRLFLRNVGKDSPSNDTWLFSYGEMYRVESSVQQTKIRTNPNVEVNESASQYIKKWDVKLYTDKIEFTRETNPKYRFFPLPKPGSTKRVVIAGVIDQKNPDICFIYLIGYHSRGDDLQFAIKQGLFRERP